MTSKKKGKHKIPPPQAKPQDKMRRMVHDHIDLLQNIEFMIVRRYRINPEIDDVVVVRALRSIISAEEPQDARALDLVEDFLEMEGARPPLDDRLWADAYRVVLESVYRHSTLQPGNRYYLDFVAEYIPMDRAA